MTAESTDAVGSEAAVFPATPPAPVKVGAGFIVVLALANFGIWIALLTPVIITLQVKVQTLVHAQSQQAIALSLVLVTGSVFGIVVNPIAGRLSDRTTSRFGMRRPWLLAGGVIAFLGSIIVGLSTSVALFVIGWVVIMVGLNILLAVLVALLPDHVPSAKRGLVSGVMGVGQALGGAVGAGLGAIISAHSVPAAFIVPGAVALVATVIAMIVVKDRRITKADVSPFSFSAFIGSFWVNPRRFPDFGWAWISRFAMFLGIASVVNYQLFFLQGQLHLSSAQATATVPLGVGAQTGTIVLVSIVCGPLSDRIRRRKLFVLISAIVGVAGLTVMGFSTTLSMYVVAMVLIGIAQAIYFSVDLALVTEVLPNKEKDAAKDIGVFNLSNLIPQFLAPALAPLFLIIPILSLTGLPNENYTTLFLAGAVFAIVSAITITRVKAVR